MTTTIRHLGAEFHHAADSLADTLARLDNARLDRLAFLRRCSKDSTARLAAIKEELRTLPEQIAKWDAEAARLESQTAEDLLRQALEAAQEQPQPEPFRAGLPPERLRKVWAEWDVTPTDDVVTFRDGEYNFASWGNGEGPLWWPLADTKNWSKYSLRPHGATWARVDAMADAAEKAAAPKMLDLRDLRYGVWCRMTADCSPLKRGDVFRVSCRSWVGEHINQVSVALDDDGQRRIELPHGLYELPAELVPASPAPTLLDLTKLPPGTVCEAEATVFSENLSLQMPTGTRFVIKEHASDGDALVESLDARQMWVRRLQPARVVTEGGEQ